MHCHKIQINTATNLTSSSFKKKSSTTNSLHTFLRFKTDRNIIKERQLFRISPNHSTDLSLFHVLHERKRQIYFHKHFKLV